MMWITLLFMINFDALGKCLASSFQWLWKNVLLIHIYIYYYVCSQRHTKPKWFWKWIYLLAQPPGQPLPCPPPCLIWHHPGIPLAAGPPSYDSLDRLKETNMQLIQDLGFILSTHEFNRYHIPRDFFLLVSSKIHMGIQTHSPFLVCTLVYF